MGSFSLLQTALALHAAMEVMAAMAFLGHKQMPERPLRRPLVETEIDQAGVVTGLLSAAEDEADSRWRTPMGAIFDSYGLLLLSSSGTALIAIQGEMPEVIRQRIAVALAVYHIGPIKRAAGRIMSYCSSADEEGKRGQTVISVKAASAENKLTPWLHLIAHVTVGSLLAASWFCGWL